MEHTDIWEGREPAVKAYPQEIQAVLGALSAIRIAKAMPEEYELHDAVAQALSAAGLSAKHEAPVAPRCRIDFLCGKVGIEIKKGKVPRARLHAQCARYLASPEMDALVLVSPSALSLPPAIGGKPVVIFSLNKLWGVALP